MIIVSSAPFAGPGPQLLGLGDTNPWVEQSGKYKGISCRTATGATSSPINIDGFECRPTNQLPTQGVQSLQQALKLLASTAGSKFDPGRADGTIDTQTRTALAYALNLAGQYITQYGKYVTIPLAAAIIAGGSAADQIIRDNALTLATVVATYAMLNQTTPVVANEQGYVPSGSAGTPWYKTPTGMAAIGGGALLVLLVALK